MPVDQTLPHLLTFKEVSKILRIPLATVYAISDRTDNPLAGMIKIGGRYRVRTDDLLKKYEIEPEVAIRALQQ